MATPQAAKRKSKQRYTRAHVEREVTNLGKVAEKAGLKGKGEKWVLVAGSLKYKKPWELRYTVAGQGELWVDFLPDGFLGWTAERACYTLRTVQNSWQYVIDKQEE